MGLTYSFMVKTSTIVGIIFLILLIVGSALLVTFTKDNTCVVADDETSSCAEGLLCNVGQGGNTGICMTIEECIASGSGAQAVEGSELCFQGI